MILHLKKYTKNKIIKEKSNLYKFLITPLVITKSFNIINTTYLFEMPMNGVELWLPTNNEINHIFNYK